MKQVTSLVILMVGILLIVNLLRLFDTSKAGFPELASLIQDAKQSVVNISVVSKTASGGSSGKAGKYTSLGSGVIFNTHPGYVMTNRHVLKKAARIVVRLQDGRVVEAEIVSMDNDLDIAILEIHISNLQPLPLGDSDSLQVGDAVLAIGSPFGLGQAVTFGIISALGGVLPPSVGRASWIQTDALINPGNSGGALVNMKGELIGINTAILAPGGNYTGIGFAVPINLARKVIKRVR